MKIVGIILLVVQVLAVFGGIVNGEAPFLHIGGTADIIESVGYFVPAIIGIILLVKANKKGK